MSTRKGINKTHGFTCSKHTLRFYRCYLSAKRRCQNPHDIKFAYYGGRGIRFLWRSFDEFRDDMYKSYLYHVEKFGEKNTTLERINRDGHYFLENCKWATRREQARNRSSNRLITFKGKTQALYAWEEELGLPPGRLRNRLAKGWNIEKCLTTQISGR